MRRTGRDLGVKPRSLQPFLGDRRVVIEVDQVVGDAGMLRLPLEDRLEDGRPLELVGVALVGRRGRRVQRERVMDLRLVVVGIALRNLLHRLRVGLRARQMGGFFEIGVHRSERIDVVAFALRFFADRFRLGNRGCTFGEIFYRRWNVGIP